jgi:hypothetical protein
MRSVESKKSAETARNAHLAGTATSWRFRASMAAAR